MLPLMLTLLTLQNSWDFAAALNETSEQHSSQNPVWTDDCATLLKCFLGCFTQDYSHLAAELEMMSTGLQPVEWHHGEL